jgi:hypothetical protein
MYELAQLKLGIGVTIVKLESNKKAIANHNLGLNLYEFNWTLKSTTRKSIVCN